MLRLQLFLGEWQRCGRQALSALEWKHPARILGRQSAHFVELFDFVGTELQVDGGEIVLELVQALGSDDDRGDHRLGQQPRQGNARRATVVRLGDRSDGIENLPGALFIDEREVELGAARVFRLLIFAAEFAGEQAAGKWAPNQQTGLLGFEKRNDFAFQVAAGDGVVGLQRIEAGEILELGDAERLGDLPGLPVGARRYSGPCPD